MSTKLSHLKKQINEISRKDKKSSNKKPSNKSIKDSRHGKSFSFNKQEPKCKYF